MIFLYLAIICGAAYFFILTRPESNFRAVAKASPNILFAVYLLSTGGPPLLIATMLLAAIGDVVLAFKGERRFVIGLWCFLFVLILYSIQFYQAGNYAVAQDDPWRWAGAVLIVLSTIVLLRNLWKPAGALAPAVAAYSGAMLIMGLLSLIVPSPMVFIGAALFLTSDAVLAMETFTLSDDQPLRRVTGFIVWGSYFIAQWVLVLALTGVF